MADSKPVKRINAAKVVRHEGPLYVPSSMSLDTAIEVLTNQKAAEEKEVQFKEDITCFPWDGALALAKALEKTFGWVQMQDTPSFFGPTPPSFIEVAISTTEKVSVPWGRFTLPGISGWIATGVQNTGDGAFHFTLQANTKRKYEPTIRQLFELTRQIALAESIYRNQAFSINFCDADGDLLSIPNVTFLNTNTGPVIFNRPLEDAINKFILCPIRYKDTVKECGTPLKRGVLLAGQYGTGKTLTAAWLAREATANGWTFIYVPNINELSTALVFGRDFQPCIIFGEDIDRVAGSNRTNAVNDILNTLDGVDSKNSEIMVVLTSNKPEEINEAMRRPGRIDVVLSVEPPDDEAAERLIRLYAGNAVSDNHDLSRASKLLAGRRPAVIREVVERSKLWAIWRTDGESHLLLPEDIEHSASAMLVEQDLFKPKPYVEDDVTRLAHGLGLHIGKAIEKSTRETVERVR